MFLLFFVFFCFCFCLFLFFFWLPMDCIKVALILSSVASPISQEGQSERNFPVFAVSSRFFLFFSRFVLILSWLFLFFPDFSRFPRFLANFSLSGVALCPPCHPRGYATADSMYIFGLFTYFFRKRQFCLFCFVLFCCLFFFWLPMDYISLHWFHAHFWFVKPIFQKKAVLSFLLIPTLIPSMQHNICCVYVKLNCLNPA